MVYWQALAVRRGAHGQGAALPFTGAGFPQGDPAVPVWFGMVMAKALEASQMEHAPVIW